MNEQTSSYGYVIAASCFSIQAIGIGTYISYGVFFNPLLSEFGWSRAVISGASSTAFFLMGLFGIFVGRLSDRTGPRKVMAVTGLFFGIGHLLMAKLGALWQLYLFYGLIVGVGLSSVDVLALTTTARWFANKRGIMTGIVKIGTGAGQLTVPLVASMLITNYGWRNAYSIIGVAVLLVLVAIAQLLRPEPNHMAPLPAYDRETSEDSSAVPEGGLSLSQTLHTKQFWTISAVNLVIVFCMLIIMVHIVPHARDIGISTTKAAGVLSTIGGVSMAGRFITGIAIDQIGSKRTMVFCFVLLIAGLLWLQIAQEMWMLYVFAVIYGVAHGSYFTTISPMVAEFFGIIAHGVLFGIIAFSGTVGGAIGPILGGYIFDLTARYSLAFWLCTVMSALGLALLLSLKPVEKRRSDAHA